MSRLPTDGPFELPDDSPPGVERMPVEEPRRAASLTLRSDQVREERLASMEAANRSLADALRITYRLIQLVMVGLVVMFVLSGFQQVNQSESGIRIELGKVKADALEPGFQFSLPYPLGEIIKVEKGNRTLEVDDAFWPNMSPEQRRRPLSESGAGGNDALDPSRDGSLLTADSHIVHAQFSVVYVRARPADYVQNLQGEEFETPLVRAAVQRAALRVAATVTIDDLLKSGGASGGGENSIESRIKSLSQQTLDEVECGLEIQVVSMRSITPPLFIRKDFSQVTNAQQAAAAQREQALSDRSKLLNEEAGAAAEPLLELIDAYEAALDLKNETESERLLGQIDRLLESDATGVDLEIGGTAYSRVRVSGEVARMISDAQQYRSTVVQRAQRQAETFRAKLQQYRANPAVFLSATVTEAVNAFLALPSVENVFWLPPGAQSFDLRLSPDPSLPRERERQKYEKDIENNPRVKEMRESLE